MEKIIDLQHVEKRFGQKQILWNINLSILKGSIFGILGPSGCGKSTLVKLIAGIHEATSGQITVLGKQMPSLLAMEHIGYMAQADALYPALSGRENMAFFGAMYGLKKKQLQQRIEESLAVVDLIKAQHLKVDQYSGGMKRRLSLAMAVLHQPEILILDEPTVGIDPLLRQSIWQSLNQMTKQGTTIIVTTHVMDEAEKCHQLAMMREGQILQIGTPAEIKLNSGSDTLEEAFIALTKAVNL